MDDYVVVGPHAKVSELTEDMGYTMLLRDVQFLEPGKPSVKLLGWMLERTVNGFRFMINPLLIEDIVQDSGLANSTRKCATAGVKRSSRRRDSAGTRRALELPNTSGTFVVSVSAPT